MRTPAWQAPDEPAHANYIRQVAQGTLTPVIQMGDWDNAYLETLKAEGFAPELLTDLYTIRYENHQPPLYYWLLAPAYTLSQGNLLVLRLLSVLLASGTLIGAWGVARCAFPARPALALAVMGLVAMVPQFLAIVSAVNNDALALSLIALTLWACVALVQGQAVSPLLLGLLMGLGFITKTTTYFMAGVVMVALLVRYARQWRALWRPLALYLAIAGTFALAWWLRNIMTYGFPDFLGLRAHDMVVVGQLRTDEFIAQVGTDYLSIALQTTFESFWGQFGWMAVPMRGVFFTGDNLIYSAIGALVLVSGLGWILLAARPALRGHAEAQPTARTAWASAAILGLALCLSLAMYLYYNTTFVQFQGRYLFTSLVPFACALMLGLEAIRQALLGERAIYSLLSVPAMLACLNVYLIWRVIPNALA